MTDHLDVKDIATHLGVSRVTAWRLIDGKCTDVHRHGRALCTTVDAYLAVLARHTVPAVRTPQGVTA